MVTTRKRANALKTLLISAGMEFVDGVRPLRAPALGPSARVELMRLFDALGGNRSVTRLAPGGWDLTTRDGLAVELDEQFHFTRYRAKTLESPQLEVLPWAVAYRDFCARFERAATRGGGGRWTSPSSEKMFGTSDLPGVFGQRGSARGKQRALYDAMKDIAASTGVLQLARISIYDQIDDKTVDDILYGRAKTEPEQVRMFIEDRAYGRSARTSGGGPN
ncbi:DUF7255 family protein (plasmid) [Coraliomargarita sp. W4R53]